MRQSPRQRAIFDLVRDEDVTRVVDLADRLGVSDETIRRNIKALVEHGLLTRSHGAVELAGAAVEPPFRSRMRVNAAAKKALAAVVAGLVEDGQTVMIDAGSTTAYVAQALELRRGLTVITNSLEIGRHLLERGEARVYLAGGEMRAELGAAVGADAESFIRRFRADVAILSIGGVDARAGFTDFDLDEARIARSMIESCEQTIVAGDSSKFGRRAPVAVCDASEVKTVVTDAASAADIGEWLSRHGVAVTTPARRS
ncbi:DeoR/GlpR family DNA-binding transcription regulator [Chenggangzhangella methanolivorans]|uniref:DeoR/GlpR family DNA-binding transcription regulator n=1 Tax=Chenggangzhangella methanolivorans TaxID=1437009 RepID=A0A9E6RAP9_9HYPH|nr:DeoR/GlpR family DNA-binding transcription regulator [Chenggangzhangella methanolivorans]QZO00375.1 DeoR/GlpR family DNA-binding transcription regulator [Chenggangzhangella methanolivorans]